MSYTKGKWETDGFYVCRTDILGVVSGATYICEMDRTAINDEDALANACLIAAAPDLLTACKAAFDYLPDPDSPLGLREQLYNAIYKAEQANRPER